MFSCIRLSETAFRDVSYPSDCFRIQSMAFSSRWMSNTLFNQSTSLASHPPQERMTRNFKASSAYCLLACHCATLPHSDKAHTAPNPTTKEKTLLDLMSKLCRWICSCGCCSCCAHCSLCSLCVFLIASRWCRIKVKICAYAFQCLSNMPLISPD